MRPVDVLMGTLVRALSFKRPHVIAVAVAVVAIQGWRWWKSSQTEAAGALYSAVAAASRGEDPGKAKEAMATLADKYAGTGYAGRAALLRTKQLWDEGDKAGAKAQLTWVVDYASDDDLKQIARYRLAEALLDEKNYDEALKVLDAKHSDAYAGLYADLRGDALAAAGRRGRARGLPLGHRPAERDPPRRRKPLGGGGQGGPIWKKNGTRSLPTASASGWKTWWKRRRSFPSLNPSREGPSSTVNRNT